MSIQLQHANSLASICVIAVIVAFAVQANPHPVNDTRKEKSADFQPDTVLFQKLKQAYVACPDKP
jgi:hypothetical protein